MNTQLQELTKRIPYEEWMQMTPSQYNQMLKDLLEDSKHIAFEILYPFEDYPTELDKRYHNWQLRACVELFNLADKQGITNYSENGISWAKLTDGLSKSLLSSLTSRVGIPRRTQEDTEGEDEDV